ncbi:MAG: Rrf2 family transcriptional regulator [Candidatus Omnitrophota bacterium]
MKLITRNTDYALRAICHLAKQKKMVKVAELVRVLGVPRPFMRKILQRLSKERVLESSKGQAGGFKLRLSAEKISFIQIMRIFQGQVSLSECFLKKDICPNKGRCILRKKIRMIESSVLGQLRQINIASLIEK